MKLINQYSQYQDIYNKGYRFNPEEETFFTLDVSNFKHPEGDEFQHWKVQPINNIAYLLERMTQLEVPFKEIYFKNGKTYEGKLYNSDGKEIILSNPNGTYSKDGDKLIKLEIDYRFSEVELFDNLGGKSKYPVFSANKYGDIEILQYSLRRKIHYYDVKSTSAGTVQQMCVQTRLNPDYALFCQGKYNFTEAINTPFWHPSLIEAFENKRTIEQLVITEGQFKAFKATQEGIPTVGLTSISHFRDKKFKTLHPEILEFINQCEVKNIVILWDGDCQNISSKHLEKQEELTQRPGDFLRYALTIKKLLQKFYSTKRLSIYFSMIKTDDIAENPKGIDDLLLLKKISKQDVLNDFSKIGALPGYYIDWINITSESGEKQLRQYFNLSFVGDFYRAHSELIKNKSFVFHGTTYRIEKGVPVVEIDKNLKKYMRIGPDYFRLIQEGTYNNEGEKIREDELLVPWKSSEITRDFGGKKALEDIVKLDGFCNIPNHTNYKQIVDNKWNLYCDIKHDAVAGDFPNIEKFMRHIFQDQYEMGLDYIQLLYSKPYQKLPVLALVSKEEGTGKSLFLKLLYMIFQNNMTFVTPEDILGLWSSHWVSKLIVASEETFFEKKEALEKIKNVSTADKIMRSERFVNSNLIDCFVKFVFCSNHEDDFIRLNEGASRFWVIKVKTIPKNERDTELNLKMQDEIPAFMHFIQNRTIVHEKKDRMYFDTDLTKTEAFHNIVKHSEPGVIKDLRIRLEDYFYKFHATELKCTVSDLKQYFGAKGDDFYLNKILRQYFNVDKTVNAGRYNFLMDNYSNPDEPINVKGKGRYFTFLREKFVNQEEPQSNPVDDNQTTIFDELNNE